MMGGAASPIWQYGTTLLMMAAAAACSIAGLWIATRRERFGAAGTAIVAALAVTALWALAVAASAFDNRSAGLIEAVRNLAWLFAVYRLFAGDGRHASLAPIRPVLFALAGVSMFHLAYEAMALSVSYAARQQQEALQLTLVFRLLVSIGGLVLLHNLFLGASARARLVLRWPASALALLWGFELNLYTIAWLGDGWSEEIATIHGIVVAASAALFAVGAARESEELRLRPSREVTFQTFSLLVIGTYLAAMVAVARWLTFAGGDFARLMAIGFLVVALVLSAFVLPSARLRGWLRVTVAKHLFQHRYDYRAEWLRFTRTVGKSGKEALPLEERVVQAVADIAESPAGLLLTRGDGGELALAARWQWPAAEVPAQALPSSATGFFESSGYIVDLDDVRAGKDARGEAGSVPGWLMEETRAWALVPLIHNERLTGVVVLARPPHARKLDWEDFDLLRVVGQQLASYLAEHAGQEALAEASRFDDFHRRIAFVMHDIKNLASQLSLLARNAELHADKPAFRDDMLVTLRNSADKLNTLLARLSRYGGGAIERLEDVDAAELVRSVGRHFRDVHRLEVTECLDCRVSANRDSLEQVLVHLVQNAIDASSEGMPVFLSLTRDGLHARIEVIDSGCGMSPDFVRTKLFKPFVSSKPGGFGIGAFEARELVRAMKGRLEVESREGLGSRFVVCLPLTAASGILDSFEQDNQRVA